METQLSSKGCWLWLGAVNEAGYGVVGWKRDGRHGMWLVHRLVYTVLVGPPGRVLDHLCRVRRCCNPAHLEPVTTRENTMRGNLPDVLRARHASVTHCPANHEYTPENTYYPPPNPRRGAPNRQCRTCRRLRGRKKTDTTDQLK